MDSNLSLSLVCPTSCSILQKGTFKPILTHLCIWLMSFSCTGTSGKHVTKDRMMLLLFLPLIATPCPLLPLSFVHCIACCEFLFCERCWLFLAVIRCFLLHPQWLQSFCDGKESIHISILWSSGIVKVLTGPVL